TRALQLDPKYALAHNNLGTAYWEVGKALQASGQKDKAAEEFNKAVASYEQAVALRPDYAEARFNLASAYLEMGRYKDAIQHFLRVVDQLRKQLQAKPADPSLRDSLAQAYYGLGQAYESIDPNHMAEAIGAYSKARDMNAQDENYQLAFGLALYREARFKDAIAPLKEALRLNSHLASARLALGMCYLKTNNYRAAQKELESYTKLASDDADGWFRLGYAYDQEGKYEDALKAYQRAVELKQRTVEGNPQASPAERTTYAGYLNNIGRVYFKQTRWDEAIEQFEKALEVSKDFRPALNNLALSYHRKASEQQEQGSTEEARQTFGQAEKVWLRLRDLDRNNVTVLGALADTQMAQDKVDEAKATYQQLLRIDPKNVPALSNLGLLCFRQNPPDLKSAADYFEQVIRLNPNNPIAYNNLGVVREQQGKLAEAEQLYKKALQLKPDYKDAQDNLRRIKGGPQQG
ncbi:MAG: tetratricopeptide repeat protein, partial [Abditibacteriales bacterium]|nr:tetratricopeptide repeat protein [Abditibacteriales bacterium]